MNFVSPKGCAHISVRLWCAQNVEIDVMTNQGKHKKSEFLVLTSTQGLSSLITNSLGFVDWGQLRGSLSQLMARCALIGGRELHWLERVPSLFVLRGGPCTPSFSRSWEGAGRARLRPTIFRSFSEPRGIQWRSWTRERLIWEKKTSAMLGIEGSWDGKAGHNLGCLAALPMRLLNWARRES